MLCVYVCVYVGGGGGRWQEGNEEGGKENKGERRTREGRGMEV